MTDRPPKGLGISGRALWRHVHADYGLNPAETLMLTELCRVSDTIDRIDDELAGAELMVTGSTGQPVVNPLYAEQRAQMRLAESLARSLALPMPGEQAGRRRSPTARENAMQRWGPRGVA